MTPEPDAASTARGVSSLDERELISGTSLRFALLLVVFLAAGAWMGESIAASILPAGNSTFDGLGCALAGGFNPDAGLHAGMVPALATWTTVEECWARDAATSLLSWAPAVAVATLVIGTAVLYRILPLWMARRSRYLSLDGDSAQLPPDLRPLRCDLDSLVREAEIGVQVRFTVDRSAATPGAVAFGTRRHPAVRLHGGLIVQRGRGQGPDVFRAVVLHELAHIRNGDIAVTYVAIAAWRVFLALILAPTAGLTIYDLVVTRRYPSSWGIPVIDEQQLAQVAVIALITLLARASVLRVRETYADLTARRWGMSPAALAHWLHGDGGHAHLGRAARNAFRTHPSWEARQQVLASPDVPFRLPDVLFRLEAFPMFSTGIAAGIAWVQSQEAFGVESWPQQTVTGAAAALITGIGSTAIWRTAKHAVDNGRKTPTGWLVGLWLGMGLVAGYLITAERTRWLPERPGFLVAAVATTAVVMAWTAQFADLAIRTCQRRAALRTTIACGLVPPWIVLAFVLYAWHHGDSADAFSVGYALNALGAPAAHPGLLLRIFVPLAVTSGISAGFAAGWWAVPLLWLLPLVLWAKRQPSGVPDSLDSDILRLRRTLLIGIGGGVAAAGGLLATSMAVNSVRSLHALSAEGSAAWTWIVLVITVAMVLAAVAAAVASPGRYPLISALIAAGITSLAGIATAYLLGAADGCLGAANVLRTTCTWHPGSSLSALGSALPYIFGASTLACAAAVAMVYAVGALLKHRRPTVPARSYRTGTAHIAGRRITVALLSIPVISMAAAETIDASSVTSAPLQGSQAARMGDPGSPPSARTKALQVEAWLYYGGADLFDKVYTASAGVNRVLAAVSGESEAAAKLALKKSLPRACAKVREVTKSAERYFPVPSDQGQLIWNSVLIALDDASQSCGAEEQAGNWLTLIAISSDLDGADSAFNELISWEGREGRAPGSAPIVETLGEPLPFMSKGMLAWITATNYQSRPAGTNLEHVPASDRIATITTQTCLAHVSPQEVVLDTPSWSGWSLVFPDGTRVAPVRAWSPRDFNAPLYPNDSRRTRMTAGDCRGGIIPFDIPAQEKSAPAKIVFAPPVSMARSQSLAWKISSVEAGAWQLLGSAQHPSGRGGGDAWVSVTSYAAHRAGANQYRIRATDRIGAITVEFCSARIHQNSGISWQAWNLILADGETLKPVKVQFPGNLDMPLHPTSSPRNGCYVKQVLFDIPGSDGANPVIVEYNKPLPSLLWEMIPPS